MSPRRTTPLCALLAALGCGAPRPADPPPPPAAETPAAETSAPSSTSAPDVTSKAPVSEREPEAPGADGGAAASATGRYWIAWRPLEGRVRSDEPFEVEVCVLDGEDRATPISGATVVVDAWMPDHGHGMLRQPRSVSEDEGCHRVRGMLFHMGGHWEVRIDVVVGGIAERATFDVRLP